VKRLIIGLMCFVWLASACAANQTTSAPVIDASTATLRLPSTATQTLLPTATTTAPTTPLPTIPTFTPTFDVSTIVTATPAPKAQCPTELLNLTYDTKKLESSVSDINQQFIDYTLRFLNDGGSIQSIRAQFEQSNSIFREDVTGDGTNELIIAYGIWINIFGCSEGKFQLLTTATTNAAQNSEILDVSDTNLDGLAEVIVYFDGCLGGRCPYIKILEWDAIKFKDLIPEYSRCHNLTAPLEIDIKDIGKNGTKEIIFSNNGKLWPDGLGFPYRAETLTCMWNGENFDLSNREFGTPHYRYQALQDADMAAITGDYQNALVLYEQTIFDDRLEWFTQEKGIHDFWVYHANYFQTLGEPTPTSSPSLQPDPREYESLAAYAYYRIMLLHLVQNQETDASTTYNTLQQEFGSDPYGRSYVEMATAFWEVYQSTRKMYDGCAVAIQYAVEHPEILIPLGSDYHGSQSHVYVPADVCPFR
jgi:hypothetical protein